MQYSLIFLDIDGVLNKHVAHKNNYCGTDPECVENFNHILDNTDSQIIISSAWRYLILNKHMTIVGFENMLLTHGVNCHKRIFSHTKKDKHAYEPRENQITDFLIEMNFSDKWIAIDDLELNLPNQIKTDGKIGLTRELANLAIKKLT